MHFSFEREVIILFTVLPIKIQIIFQHFDPQKMTSVNISKKAKLAYLIDQFVVEVRNFKVSQTALCLRHFP